MASVERTAYPTLSKSYSRADLQREFSFSDEELKWVRSKSKAPFHLNLAVLLKTFQVLRYFPDITDVPDQVVDFIRGELGQRSRVKLAEYKWFQQYRHMSAVRARLGVIAFYGSDAIDLAEHHAKAMSFLLDQRADIINSVIEELIRQNYELPAYSALNDLAERVHAESLESIYN
ncbi:DUF4158 domain-containing protein [Pseudomonas sp. BIC9C]|uniref:DUF4158 domain-containing protein n=1 Tax=Pseudomonas sp. BIC9C TaxID=3078458 RepID=UPI002AD24A8D|nr:DUF4158 domain-containing protein [Pseudomonas sp. BIC9C]